MDRIERSTELHRLETTPFYLRKGTGQLTTRDLSWRNAIMLTTNYYKKNASLSKLRRRQSATDTLAGRGRIINS